MEGTKPMPGEKGSVTFEKTYDIKGAKLLSTKLEVKAEVDFEIAGVDKAMIKKIQSYFKKEMDTRIKGQLAHLETWLKEKQKKFDEADAKIKAVKKRGIPEDGNLMKALAKDLEDIAGYRKELSDVEEAFTVVVDAWSKNVVEQQGLIAMQLARKKAGKAAIADKNARIILKKVVKGILIVGGTALAITLIVLSAGTATPLVMGLGIAALALSTTATVGLYAKEIHSDYDQEKKLLKTVEGQLDTIRSALKPISDSNLGKHVAELENRIMVRKSMVAKLKMELKKLVVALKGETAALRKFSQEKTLWEWMSSKEVHKRISAREKLQEQSDDAVKKISAAEKRIIKGEALIRELKEIGVKADEFSNFYKSSTVGGHLKDYVTSAEGWADMAKTVSGFSGLGKLG
ncbi:MAG: hypothetical protein ACI8R4_000692 [Paracoccaceae bacterium]|jgi:hypothetical protein